MLTIAHGTGSVGSGKNRTSCLNVDLLILPYSLDQTQLSNSRRSRIVAAPPDVLNEIVAALVEY